MATKRYLVLRDFDYAVLEDPEHKPVHFRAGEEVELNDEVFTSLNHRNPGALTEMHPKTKTDWES